jgi:hypothetical protein
LSKDRTIANQFDMKTDFADLPSPITALLLNLLPHWEAWWILNGLLAKMILQDVTFASQSTIETYHRPLLSPYSRLSVPLTAMVSLSLFLLSAKDSRVWVRTIFALLCENMEVGSIMT